MRQPIFLVMGIVFAASFAVVGWGPDLRAGRAADDPKYDPLRRRIGQRIGVVGMMLCLAAGLLLAFLS